MPASEQVRDRLPRPTPVVDEDAVGLDPAWRAVDEDRGKAGPDLGGEVGLVQGRRHEDETVDPAGDEVGDEGPFAVGLLVDARGQDDALALAGGVLEAAEQAHREAVAHVLHQGADDSGTTVAAAEVARGEVVGVVQSFDGPLDPFAQVVGNTGFAVDHPGDGLEAHAGEGGDVAHRRPTQSGCGRLRR